MLYKYMPVATVALCQVHTQSAIYRIETGYGGLCKHVCVSFDVFYNYLLWIPFFHYVADCKLIISRMHSNGHPYLVESQRKLVTLYESMYNTSKERCPAAFGQKRTSMVENIYVASPIAQLYAEKLAQPPPTVISPAPRILKVPVPQSTPLVNTHRAETQVFINRPHSIGADPASVTTYYDPSTIQPSLNRSTSFVHSSSVSAIPGPSLNSSGSSVGDFRQDSHSHESVSHFRAQSHTVSSPVYQNAYLPDSCDSATPPGSPRKHVPLKSLTPEFVAIRDEQVVVCRMPDRRDTSLDVSAENHYPEYTSPLSCYSKRPCRLIQELDKVKELSKNEELEGRESPDESGVKKAGSGRYSYESSKVSQVSQADRLNNVDMDSEVLDLQAPEEGSDVSDGIEDEIDELKPYTDENGERQCSSPETFERLSLHKESSEIEDIGAEDVVQSKSSTSVRNPSCDSHEDDEVDKQRTQNDAETFSTSESETDLSDSNNGGTFEEDAKEDMVDEVDLLTGLTDSNPKKTTSRRSTPEVDMDTYTKRDSDFKEETSKNRSQIKRTKQPFSKKHVSPIAETHSDTESPKRPQQNWAQSFSRKKRSSASSEMNIDTDTPSSRNQGNTIKKNAVQLDHKKAKKSEAGHKFSQKKTQEAPAVTPRSSRSNTLHETPTTSMPKEKVKEYVLTEWIIRPINSCKGVFVEGKVEGREDDFWHSTAIVKRLSNSRVQSNTGSQYVLVGPIDREYTLDAGFSRKTVNAFKKGFPSEWREVISKHFEEEDRSKSSKKPEKFQEIKSTPKNSKKTQKNKSHSLLSDSSDINVKDLPRTRSGRRVFPQLAWWACQRVKSFPQADLDLVEVTPPSAAMNTSISSSRHVNIKTDERSLRLKELMKKRLLEKGKKHKEDPSTTVSDSEESFSRLADVVTDEASEGSRKVRGQVMVKEKSMDQESPKNENVRKQLKEKEFFWKKNHQK
ncbi:uncharacterized protein LOC106164982 [Lingula anatina]|uniref:Uncharacterized protein LOC106164982 n=1 Tax=Lingula anatina TaxID=7574 RepID=A0A1S3IJT8_LINAN|nr:uncharacterized protein LOC106164982 [Lingula anatina]|eukprot:XP_013398505.1 uncharacterized protein LOC106164982 [Lingula anatina]